MRGLRVAASASEQNHAFIQSLGAEVVVDYHNPDWTEQIESRFPGGVAAAIGIHPGTARQSEAVVRTGGTIVAISGDRFDPERDIEVKQRPHDTEVTAELEYLVDQVESGAMRVEIGRVYPFAEGLGALARVATRHTRGKLVLTME